jgi:hypothetical protein
MQISLTIYFAAVIKVVLPQKGSPNKAIVIGVIIQLANKNIKAILSSSK